MAVVYMTRLGENGETVTEGICLKCAKELGIKPVNDILDKMGLTPDDIDNMVDGIDGIPGSSRQIRLTRIRTKTTARRTARRLPAALPR